MSPVELQIKARAALVEQGLHPFQQAFNAALRDPSHRIICVEAPVGAGKSHIVRTVLEEPNEGLVVLTYPTKILMQTQLTALRDQFSRDGRDLCIWPDPDDNFRPQAVNIINYSTDAVMHLLRSQGPSVLREHRGQMLNRLFNEQKWRGQERAVVTSPDVLHLVSRSRYKDPKRLAQWLVNGLFVFDEFHLYHNLVNFVPLLEKILNTWHGRIVLLSATPIEHEELADLLTEHNTIRIRFDPDSAAQPDSPTVRVFNHPLSIQIESFRTTDLTEWMPRLQRHLPQLRHPTAIILDSVHRLQWLRRCLEPLASELGLQIAEWSGLTKDRVQLTDRTIVLGTAAIEVGIDFQFHSLIFEATYWPSAIQRLGRVGRHGPGKAIIFSRREFAPFLETGSVWDRTEFEQPVLRQALLEPIEGMVGGEMFRGDSYQFVLVDADARQPKYYDQSIFSMYDIQDAEQDWRELEPSEKGESLQDLGLPSRYVDEVLLRDKVFPFWGAIRGRLRPEYVHVTARKRQDELIIQADRNWVFAGMGHDNFEE